ncbi:hypothetical protein LC1Hm_4175 (plasmid) [Halomicrobium sp. LC1Hm]|nr:hypothetical protein LC1Hm_4175 [Halomicrobium sp. LC1Hm]
MGRGKLKISRDYTCVCVTGSPERLLPDWDVRGHSIVASDAGGVQYTGDVVEVVERDRDRGPTVTLLCKPPEPHGK